jgi:amino acid efflux transporter
VTTSANLSTTRAAALYIGALLGPSLLLLPGLAAALAGPASILAWIVLLIVSALLARVFTVLGTRFRSAGGVEAYAAAGFGPSAGRAVGWCFLAGVVCGAPVVCLIGGSYVGVLLGGGRAVGLGAAMVLLLAVLAFTLGGARATAAAQVVLIGVMLVLIAVAVIGSVSAARRANWTPFTPHGRPAIGTATAVLMMSAVGWEAIAPLTARLRDPDRQLPRVIAIAFAVTATVYLALAFSTVAVLGPAAGSSTPLSDLLRVAVGASGPAVAAIAAVALTLATTNAYLTGAAAMAAELRSTGAGRLQLGTGLVGLLILAAVATDLVSTAQLVAVPTTLFLTVYLGCTAAATRLFAGGMRVIAALSCVAVAVIMCFAGWALLAALVVVLLAAVGRSKSEHSSRPQHSVSLARADDCEVPDHVRPLLHADQSR